MQVVADCVMQNKQEKANTNGEMNVKTNSGMKQMRKKEKYLYFAYVFNVFSIVYGQGYFINLFINLYTGLLLGRTI